MSLQYEYDQNVKYGIDGLTKGGLITSIVGCLIAIFSSFVAYISFVSFASANNNSSSPHASSVIWSIGVFLIPIFFIFAIAALVFNCMALKNLRWKKIAGILSIIAGLGIGLITFIGGILTLCGKIVPIKQDSEAVDFYQINELDEY